MQNIPLLKQRHTLENNHMLASNTLVSSPCDTFKIKCKIISASFYDYELSILYYNQTIGERYLIGQEIKLYHEKDKWFKKVKVVSRRRNLLEVEIMEPVTIITNIASDGTKTQHICEFLGLYSNLYRVNFDNSDRLNGTLSLHLPNGESYPVKLRWREGNEVCFQATNTRNR